MSKSLLWIYTRFWQWTLLTWLHRFWTRSPTVCSKLCWVEPRKFQRGFSFGYYQANSRFVWGRWNFLALDSMPSLFQYGLDGKQGYYWWKLDEDNNASTSLSWLMEKFIQKAMFTSININGNKLLHATNRFTTTQLSFLISCFIYLLIAHPDSVLPMPLKYLFFYLANKSPPDRFFLNRRTSKQRLRDSRENFSVKLNFLTMKLPYFIL